MSVSSATSGTSTTASTSSTSSSSSSSASGIQATQAWTTFLAILTTQLKNQDPLNPTDSNQMTEELIGLSQLEQQLGQGQTLSSINASINDLTAANGLGYMGSTVTATGSTAPLQNGSATWDYNVNSAASQVKLSITDSSGNTVWTGTGDTTAGNHTLSWDGQSSAGKSEPAGAYTLSVQAIDSTGKSIITTTSLQGVVTGVDSSSGTTQLKLGSSVEVPLASVSAIASTSGSSSSTSTASTSSSASTSSASTN